MYDKIGVTSGAQCRFRVLSQGERASFEQNGVDVLQREFMPEPVDSLPVKNVEYPVAAE